MSVLSELRSSTASTPLRLAALFYLAHVLCEGWIASSQSFLGLSIVAILVAYRQGEVTFRFHLLHLPLLLFVAGSFTSALFAPSPVESFIEANEWYSFAVFLLAMTLYGRLPALVPVVRHAFAGLTIFLALYGLFQYFILDQRDLEHRIRGMTAHVMTYSGILLALTLFFLVFAFYERKTLWLTAGTLGVAALVLTFTRGAWIGFLAGVATFLLLRSFRLFAYAVPVVLLAVTLAPSTIFARFASSFDLRQSSNLDRVRMLQAAVEMIKDRPLTGMGPGEIKQTYPLYRASDAPRFRIPHLHNNIAQIWAERGLLPLLAYLMLLGSFALLCFRARHNGGAARAPAEAGLAITVALFVAGFFEFNFGDTEVLLTMLDLYALILALIDRANGVQMIEESSLTGGPSRAALRLPSVPATS